MKRIAIAVLVLLAAPAAGQVCPNDPPLRIEKGAYGNPAFALTSAQGDQWYSNVRALCDAEPNLWSPVADQAALEALTGTAGECHQIIDTGGRCCWSTDLDDWSCGTAFDPADIDIAACSAGNAFTAIVNGVGTCTPFAPSNPTLGSQTQGNYAAGDAEAGNATGVACTDCVTLGTETSGGYAASASEAGPATTATALAANPTDCGLGEFAHTIDAGGNLTCAAAVTQPGGNLNEVQYNDGGTFAGDAGLTYDGTTDALAVGASVSVPLVTSPDAVNIDINPGGAGNVILPGPDTYIGTDSCSGNCPTGIHLDLNTSGSLPVLRVLAGNDANSAVVAVPTLVILKSPSGGENAVGWWENGSGNPRLSLASGGQINFTSTVDNINPGQGDVIQRRARAGGWSLDAQGFAVAGDARTVINILRRTTTNATPAELFLDGSSERMVLTNDTSWSYDCVVTARRTDADGESASYHFGGAIDRQTNAASTALVGAVQTIWTLEDTAAWDAAPSADTSNGALILTVTGEAAKTINWVARCETTEVTG